MQLSKEKILDALTHVRYPGTGKDIVTAGMVQDDIKIEGNKVSFSIQFEKSNDPFIRSVVKATEQTILTYIGKDVDIIGNINIIAKEQPQARNTEILPNVKNSIAVFSGKGGVGKSTVAVNLAIALGKLGYKVGLLDADIHGPSIPKMLGVENEIPIAEKRDGVQKIIPIEKYGIKLLSIGFFIDKEKALVWRGAMASNALKQLITDVDWGELDYFIMDLPPGTGDIHLTLVQTMGITGAVVVTTPQDVALADAKKGINMFKDEKVNVPILGLVENMAWFTPEELPNNKYYIFGKEGGAKLAQKLHIDLLSQIPIVQSIRESGDKGVPISQNTTIDTSLIFEKLAQNVIKKVDFRNKYQEATKKVYITNLKQ